MALAMLIGGDFIYKYMLRVAFGLKKLSNTVLLFETKKPNVDLSRNILTALALKDKCDWIFGIWMLCPHWMLFQGCCRIICLLSPLYTGEDTID